MPSAVLSTTRVSSRSRWTDPAWILDNPTPGQTRTASTLRWDIRLPDGSRLVDPPWAELLDALRRTIWSLFAEPVDRKPLKPGMGLAITQGLRGLVSWMSARGYGQLAQLDDAASREFLEDAVGLLATAEAGEVWEGLRRSHIQNAIVLWRWLYQQGPALQAIGIAPVPEPPFGGRLGWHVWCDISGYAKGFWLPLPDEVALPVMAAAVRFLGVPADDVIALQSQFVERRAGLSHLGNSAQCARLQRLLAGYAFRVIPGESEPWRLPLAPTVVESFHAGAQASHGVQKVLLDLVIDVRDAAVITLQSAVGLRINEICGLRVGGLNQATGLPDCIAVRLSRTGLSEIFYLKGYLAKTCQTNEAVEWVLGTRPVGSTELPLPVLAVCVLQRLFDPWRTASGRDQLVLGFRFASGLPHNADQVIATTRADLAHGQARFVWKYAGLHRLPNFATDGTDLRVYRNFRGRMFRTHQWRKTFALHVFRTDSRMLPALSQHFKHLSLAMTEQGYLGNDPQLLTALDDVRQEQTVRFLFEAATGKRLIAGGMAELLRQHGDELRKLASGSPDPAYRRVAAWVVENDLRLWFSEHGKCLIGINPSAARCHEIAGTDHWLNREPHYGTREPNVCAGCRCFAVDREHADYWKQRFLDYNSAYRTAEAAGDKQGHHAIRALAAQAASVLKALDVEIPQSHRQGGQECPSAA